MKDVIATYLGRTDYKETWDLQKQIFNLKCESSFPDVLILNEHNHVYTIGKSGNEDHVLADEKELADFGAKIYQIDRGGDVTYHGPGQLVGYPILDLNNYYKDIHRYLRDIEEVIILTLKDFGIDGIRNEGYTGVWVGGDKIAAIGVKVSRWITMHGFAFNLDTDLSYFNRIIPCGIFHKGVTTLNHILKEDVTLDKVISVLIRNFATIFQVNIKLFSDTDFIQIVNEQSNKEDKCLQNKILTFQEKII
jgi:lipoyl(octanoyl) transferase